ncbi:MAG: MoxR family ATPase [Syntrophomonadaceae bacterium]|nr:MoxR family ATPase [Syntrophomonadaceae bacterium]
MGSQQRSVSLWINQGKEILLQILSLEQPPAVMLWGPPGIGKSALIRQIARGKNWGVVDLRMLLLNPVDLRGIPVPDRERRQADWLPAGFLPNPQRDGPQGILFLDEINAAPPAVQASAYQLLLDRKSGEYLLPPGWRIVAAGNRVTDRGVINRMPAPLANRMLHFELSCELSDWKSWALVNGIDPAVIAFLNFRPELLYRFPEGAAEIRAFPSPRSWEFVSRLIPLFSDWDQLFHAVASAVGEGAAFEFIGFARLAEELPDPEAILAGEEFEVPDQPDLLYALASGLVHRLRADPRPPRVERFLASLLQMPPEFQVMAMKDAWTAGLVSQITASPRYPAWAKANQSVIL